MNEYFYMLVSIITSIIIFLIAFNNISPYKLNIKEYILMVFSIASICMIIFTLNSRLYTISLYLTPIFFIYKKSHRILESVVLQIVILLVIILVDNFTGTMAILITSSEFLATKLGNKLACTAIALLVYLVSKLVGKFYKKYRDYIYRNYKSKYSILIYIILISTFILFYVNINWNKSSNPVYLTKVNGIMFITYGLVTVIVCFCLLFMINKEHRFKYKQMQLENLTEYTEKLEKVYMDMRKFRHDYINIISSMAMFIENKDINGLEEHFNKHIYPLNKKINKNNYKLGLLKNVQMPEIKGIISAKIIHAQEMGLDVIIDMVEPIVNINMDIIDLSRVLGIILDNAIEASLESEKKIVNLALINKNNSVIIVVINTFKDNVPPLSKLFKEGFSTKGDNRGLGLSNLKDIISKYKNISLDTFIKEDRFVQEITVSNKS